ncbi:MAG: methylmalonyl-CoA epimerase [Candidatus Zixiibacteriota bacterium]|nr:MAG: methylmalonyl-CoA epimerase [candidate division Zixibacteria bacterium]
MSHIGIAVSDLEEAVRKYEVLIGRKPFLTKEVPDQKVKVAIFYSGKEGAGQGDRLELLAPTGPEGPVAKFIKKRGEGLHHICLYVDDVKASMAALKAVGLQLIDESPRIGAEGSRIAFVHPGGTNGVLIELEESAD